MKNYMIENLKTDGIKPNNNKIFEKAVNFYAQSELPNEWFLQQFSPTVPDTHVQKSLWVGFACVLIERGLPEINDVKEQLLWWWKDANWPGWREMRQFVVNNGAHFINEAKKVLENAYIEKDIGWFKNLIEFCLVDIDDKLTKADKAIIDEMLEYIDDDIWKQFDLRYSEALERIFNLTINPNRITIQRF